MPRFLNDKKTPIPKVKKKNYSLKQQMKKLQKEPISESVGISLEPSYTFDDDSLIATLSCGREYAGSEIEIPSTVEKDGKIYRIEIGFLAFRECSNLKEIILPEGSQRLLRSTFLDCSNLERIVISTSIKEILPCQFIGCKNLKEIILMNPEGIEMNEDIFAGLDYDKVKVIDQSQNIEYFLGEFIKKHTQI